MAYTYIVLYYFPRSLKALYIPIHQFTHQYQTLAPSYNRHDQHGVLRLAQGHFNKWVCRAGAEPTVFQSKVVSSTSAPRASQKHQTRNLERIIPQIFYFFDHLFLVILMLKCSHKIRISYQTNKKIMFSPQTSGVWVFWVLELLHWCAVQWWWTTWKCPGVMEVLVDYA